MMPEPINLVSEALEEMEGGSFRKALELNPELAKLFQGAKAAIAAVEQAANSGPRAENYVARSV